MRRIKNLLHLLIAILANIYYGYPSRKLTVISVTGTDGKTTVANLIYHLLKLNNKKVSMISTVYAKIGDNEFSTGLHTTTPGSFLVQKLLKQAVDHHDQYFILETTSHAIDQNRVYGIRPKISVITNITHEHLDYHYNYDQYLTVKAQILLRSDIALINSDDLSYSSLKQLLKDNNKKFYTYGLNDKADFTYKFNQLELNLAKFNQYNYLAAYSVLKILGYKDTQIIPSLKSFALPEGRLNVIYNKKYKVIIDFAHTPNAIAQVLPEIRRLYLSNKGRLIHVFGSAGLRDFTKRSLMGEESGKYSNIVILTEEDYRTEDPYKICEQIANGLIKQGFKYIQNKLLDQKDNKIYTIIINRQEAITKALSIVKKDDVIVITGKGHEQSLCRGKTEYPWSDKQVVKTLLKI